jgi:hypothetical protein
LDVDGFDARRFTIVKAAKVKAIALRQYLDKFWLFLCVGVIRGRKVF